MHRKYGVRGEMLVVKGYNKELVVFILECTLQTPTLALIGDIGWSTAQLKRHRNIMRYWNRLIQMDDTRLTITN